MMVGNDVDATVLFSGRRKRVATVDTVLVLRHAVLHENSDTDADDADDDEEHDVHIVRQKRHGDALSASDGKSIGRFSNLSRRQSW